MKFCRNCGGELAQEARFCKHCGFDLTSENQARHKDQANRNGSKKELYTKSKTQKILEDPSPNKEKQNDIAEKIQSFQLSKSSKIFMTIAGALIVFLLIGLKIGESQTSYEKKIEKLEEAIFNSDAKTLVNLLTTDHQSMLINENSVSGLIEFYQKYPSEMNNLIQHLKAQGNHYKIDSDSIDIHDENYPINLVKKGRIFIYDHFKIQVSPVYFDVYTNYEDTEILINGEIIATATTEDFSKEFGPYLPGTYTFRAKHSSDYVDLETKTVQTNVDPGYVSEVDLYLEASDVFFESSYYDQQALDVIHLYINDEDTGINLIEQHTVGPLPTDGSIEVAYEGEFPWGPMKSENFSLEADHMDVSFSLNEEFTQTIQDLIIQYNKEYMKAYTTADDSVLTVAAEQMVEEIIEDAEYDQEQEHNYSGKFIGIGFYEEAFNLSFDEGGYWYVSVGTDIIVEENSSESLGSLEPEITEKEMEYELIYDAESDEWTVINTRRGSYMMMETAIEHREEDPITYTSAWAGEEETDKTEE